MENQNTLADVGLKMSNKEYREREGVSSTDLKKMAQSPAHFRCWKDNPQEDTPTLLFGRAAHKYMLEKDDFFNEFSVAPAVDRRTKAGKEQWQQFLESSNGKDIISEDDFKTILEMRKALYATPFVARLLSGIKERSFFTRDEETGLLMKCRVDCLTQEEKNYYLVDYKTTTDADNTKFYKESVKLDYDLQMAYYRDILEKCTGINPFVIIICQEKKAPYVANVLELPDMYIKSGRDIYRSRLKKYKYCNETGDWHGYVRDKIDYLGQPEDDDKEDE